MESDSQPRTSCYELNPGDAVEAFRNGVLVHRGPVTDIAFDHGIFWILDTLTGSRRFIDLTELTVQRLSTPVKESWLRDMLGANHHPRQIQVPPAETKDVLSPLR